tara:strand:+ start:1732 stop:1929 length:198 start_codon:yes stop_codon:yes gene_type:complete
MIRGKRFIGKTNDIVKYNGVKAKIINIEWCSYTNQELFNVKELAPPYYQVRAIGALWGCLEKINL